MREFDIKLSHLFGISSQQRELGPCRCQGTQHGRVFWGRQANKVIFEILDMVGQGALSKNPSLQRCGVCI